LFTIVTVVRSKIRYEGVREGSISVEEVVEDLVAETITEPMLDSERKLQILENLTRLYRLGPVSRFLERNPVSIEQLFRWFSQEYSVGKEGVTMADEKEEVLRPAEGTASRLPSLSTFFGFIAVLISAALLGFYQKELVGIFNDFGKRIPFPEFFIGAVASGLALAISSLSHFVLGRAHRNEKRTKRKHEAGG